MTLRVGVAGAAGRMGRALCTRVLADTTLALAAAWEHPGHAALGEAIGGLALASAPALSGVDVAIDFTSPAATRAHLALCVESRVPLVIGTTGLSPADHALIDRAAASIPVLQAANTSVGVCALLELVQRAAELVGPGFDLEIVESHHRAKRDAPSGTALALLGALQKARPDAHGVFERHGDVGPRRADEIGVQTLRGGDVVGEHTVYLYGLGERLELTHRATDRGIFADGALRAARWLAGKTPGRYTMPDVLRR